MSRIKFLILLLCLVTMSTFSQEKKYITYKVLQGETIESVCKKLSITPYSLTKLNPDIKAGIREDQLLIIPNKNYKPTQDTATQEGDQIRDGFLYHKVLPKENFYRLKKKYRVSKRMLRKHNVNLRTGGLKVGQIIKIPVPKNLKRPQINVVQSTKTKPYLVKPRETKYSIARRYGITIEQLEALNPQIKEGLKLAEIIKVPDTEEIPDSEEGFVYHRVEKRENFFQLEKQFGTTKEELIALNPSLNEGLKEGMLIKIPNDLDAENTTEFVANILVNNDLEIKMLLPFTTNKKSLDFENDRTLNIVTDFYLGAIMALDSLKKQGLRVKVQVLDTQNNKNTVANILRVHDFDSTDAIIGPMFTDNIKIVSQKLGNSSAALISPVSSKDHSEFASDNTIQETPTSDQLATKVLTFIKENYSDQQLIVIGDDLKENQLKQDKIVAELEAIDSIQNITFLKPKKGYIKPDLFREKIQEKKDNWIVLITDDAVVTADVVNNLGVLPEKVTATLFTLEYGNNFDRVDNNFLARVNFHFPTSTYIDYEDYGVKKFIKKYKMKNHLEPSEYVFKGFDITYNTLIRLASFPNFKSAYAIGVLKGVSSEFRYLKKPNKGFENKGVFLVKYDGLNLKKIE